MAYACKTASARKIVGVIPYMPYSKQSKMRKRGAIVSKLLATMISKSGLISFRVDFLFDFFYVAFTNYLLAWGAIREINFVQHLSCVLFYCLPYVEVRK